MSGCRDRRREGAMIENMTGDIGMEVYGKRTVKRLGGRENGSMAPLRGKIERSWRPGQSRERRGCCAV